MLGRDVGRRPLQSDQPRDRGGIDDRPATLRLHPHDLVFHAEPHALQVHGDHAVEGVLGPFRRQLTGCFHLMRRDAGVVEGAIQAAISRHRTIDHRRDIGRVGDIAADRNRLPAAGIDQPDGFAGGIGFEVRDRDPSSLARKCQGCGASDAVAATGHQRGLAVQYSRHRVLPFVSRRQDATPHGTRHALRRFQNTGKCSPVHYGWIELIKPGPFGIKHAPTALIPRCGCWGQPEERSAEQVTTGNVHPRHPVRNVWRFSASRSTM